MKRRSALSWEELRALDGFRGTVDRNEGTGGSVAGRPVASRVRIPFEFCSSDDKWCERQSRKTAGSGDDPQSGPMGYPMVLDSVVHLLTAVRGQEI